MHLVLFVMNHTTCRMGSVKREIFRTAHTTLRFQLVCIAKMDIISNRIIVLLIRKFQNASNMMEGNHSFQINVLNVQVIVMFSILKNIALMLFQFLFVFNMKKILFQLNVKFVMKDISYLLLNNVLLSQILIVHMGKIKIHVMDAKEGMY